MFTPPPRTWVSRDEIRVIHATMAEKHKGTPRGDYHAWAADNTFILSAVAGSA